MGAKGAGVGCMEVFEEDVGVSVFELSMEGEDDTLLGHKRCLSDLKFNKLATKIAQALKALLAMDERASMVFKAS
ncbi:hypothetical protein TIFTF001_039867 [Ficus carica]|uniref:Uncharacterized protein n=1 Tax=Ficus carica TaxID=3494 RepID=A0AA87Z7X7_FICCA|nr:hypothetical protein TIFTF001_039867 [Ficus carica]